VSTKEVQQHWGVEERDTVLLALFLLALGGSLQVFKLDGGFLLSLFSQFQVLLQVRRRLFVIIEGLKQNTPRKGKPEMDSHQFKGANRSFSSCQVLLKLQEGGIPLL